MNRCWNDVLDGDNEKVLISYGRKKVEGKKDNAEKEEEIRLFSET